MTTQSNSTVNETENTNETYESVEDYCQSLDSNYDDDVAKKIKAFISWHEDNRGFDPMLTIAVIEQFDVEAFMNYAEDVTNHGIMGGFSGWVYYDETEAFYLAHRDKIIQWAKNLNESIGSNDSYLAMIAEFNLMKQGDFDIDQIAEMIYTNNQDLDDFAQFANNMAWGVAEDVCRDYTDFLSEYDEDEEDEDEE